MALALDDADRMLSTASRTRTRLGSCCKTGTTSHAGPEKAIDENRLGKLLLGNATVRWYRTQEYYEDEWHGRGRWTAALS